MNAAHLPSRQLVDYKELKAPHMGERTMRKIHDSMPEGHRLCPVCNGAGELVSDQRGDGGYSMPCRRCRENGTVKA